jgi:hypothetical protein
MGQDRTKWDKCPMDKASADWDRTGHTPLGVSQLSQPRCGEN